MRLRGKAILGGMVLAATSMHGGILMRGGEPGAALVAAERHSSGWPQCSATGDCFAALRGIPSASGIIAMSGVAMSPASGDSMLRPIAQHPASAPVRLGSGAMQDASWQHLPKPGDWALFVSGALGAGFIAWRRFFRG